MTNPLTKFTQENITEIILGLAIAIIAVLLMNLNFEESMTIILLGPLIALVSNKLLESIVPNVKNQRIALVIIGVIGLIIAIQYFQVGVFSLDNITSQSFIEANIQPQAGIISLPIEVTGALIAAIGKLPFLVGLVVILAVLIMNPATAIIGWVLLALIGIPALIVLGVGTFLIAKNFTLILVLVSGFFMLKLIFGSSVKKVAKT